MSGRFVLCRPRGGLNDTLCGVNRCLRLAEQTGRHLVIDTSKSVVDAPFGKLFNMGPALVPVTLSPEEGVISPSYALTRGPLVSEEGLPPTMPTMRYVSTKDCGGLARGRIRQLFGLAPKSARDAPETLLIYEQAAGGTESLALLERISLSAFVMENVGSVLERLGTSYDAIHVRNTDYQTDYPKLFAAVRDKLNDGPVLVCSDDPQVIDDAHRFLKQLVVTVTMPTPSTHPTGRLHLAQHPDRQTTHPIILDSLCDLIALANARRLFYAPVQGIFTGRVSGNPRTPVFRATELDCISGFSQLAHHLCVRKDVLDAMLGVPPEQRRAPDPSAASNVPIADPRRRRWIPRGARLWRRA